MKKLIGVFLCLWALYSSAQNADIQREINLMNYEKALTLMGKDSKEATIIPFKIQALKGLNRYSEALSLLKGLKKNEPDNEQWNILLAECYKSSGNLYEACKAYNDVLKKDPEHSYARLQLINCLHSVENYPEMVNVCHDFIKRDSCALAFRLLGQAYEGKQDFVNAFGCYNKAYRKDSTDYLSLALATNIMNNNKQYKDVVDVTEKYRRRDSTNVYVNQQNAKAHYFSQNYPTAIRRYEQLKKLGDHSFVTYCYLGISNYITQDFYAAKENLDTANILKPDDMYVLYYLAHSCVRTSWKKQGLKYMEQAIELTSVPDTTMIWLYDGLVDCYSHGGSSQQQISALKKLYSYQPYPIYLYKIGCLCYYLKDIKEYSSYLNRYLATEPKNRKPKVINGKEVFTTYDDARKRLNDLKEDEFFKGNLSWEEFIKLKLKNEQKKTQKE